MTRPRSVRARAFAKVNLDLRVLGRRADGYHEIRTIFQTLELHDTLTFSARHGPFAVSSTSPDLPTDGRNIVSQAASALWRASGRKGEPQGVSVHIVKRIPVEAGLGGGSSDAAATLVTLDRLWKARLPPAELIALASALGSDVPFFMLGGTAVGLGRGEVLYPLPDLAPAAVVIARPAEGVSTRDAYGWLDAGESRPARTQALDVPWPPQALSVANDFEPVVLPRLPAAARLRKMLAASGASLSMLSGSGSAVFAVFPGDSAAHSAAARVRGRSAGVWVTRFRRRLRRRPAG